MNVLTLEWRSRITLVTYIIVSAPGRRQSLNAFVNCHTRTHLPRGQKLTSEQNDKKENNNNNNCGELSNDDGDTVVYNETEMGEITVDVKKEEEVEHEHCKFCDDDPCVWLSKKEGMLTYDDNKHGLKTALP
jgi:hypothetical protein